MSFIGSSRRSLSFALCVLAGAVTLAVASGCAATNAEATGSVDNALSAAAEEPSPTPSAPRGEQPSLPSTRDCNLGSASCSEGYACEAGWCALDAQSEKDDCNRAYQVAQLVWKVACADVAEGSPNPQCARANADLRDAVNEYNRCMTVADGSYNTCLYTQKQIMIDCIVDRNGDHPRL